MLANKFVQVAGGAGWAVQGRLRLKLPEIPEPRLNRPEFSPATNDR